MASSGTSGDAYSFSIDCPVCEKVVTFSSTREEMRGDTPIAVSCVYCTHNWTLSAEDKEQFWRQINTSF